MGQKQDFLNLLKNLVIDIYWICSMMKTYIIFCVPAQILHLGKFLFLRNGPKCSQPIRLQDSLINHIFRTNQWNSMIFGQRWVWSFRSWDRKTCCILRISLWIELIFECWLWWNSFWLDQHCTLYIWLLNASLLLL